MAEQIYKSEYLTEDFRLFYNADRRKRSFPAHYHDFHKLLLFLSGNVSYIVEGRQYDLQPGDVILVPAGSIHNPVIHDASLYERIIFYISPAFFDRYRSDKADLFPAFRMSADSRLGLLRLTGQNAAFLKQLSSGLIRSASDSGYARDLLQETYLVQVLILLSRCAISPQPDFAPAAASNPAILKVMDYIGEHLTEEDLSIDRIASAALQSRSYLMHLFKEQTGYTIGEYITEKRLFLARKSLNMGMSVTDACYGSGFRSYSAFYYAYRKKYGGPPKQAGPEEAFKVTPGE